jgi:hypothetical protein
VVARPRATDGRPLASSLRRVCRHARARRLRRFELRRRRASLPARGGLDRRGRKRRRERRVRDARLRRLLPVRAGQARRGDAGTAERASRGRLPAADRTRVRARRRACGRALPRRYRGAGGGARLPPGPAGGARPLGNRRGAGRRAQPALPRLRHRGLPRTDRRRGARGGRTVRAQARHTAQPRRRVWLLRPPRHSPLAGDQVRAGGACDRLLRSPCALASAATNAGDRCRRGVAFQRGAVRRHQRSPLRRPHPVCG